MKLHLLLTKILVVFLVTQVLTSCLLLPGRLLPKVSKFPKKSLSTRQPSVYIIPHYHTFNKFTYTEPVETVIMKKGFAKMLKKIAERSGVFESYTFNKDESNGVDFTLEVDLLDYDTEKDLRSFRRKSLLSVLSLWIIPVSYVENYKLTARLLDSNGNQIRTFLYEDNVRLLVDLIFLPFGIVTNGVPNNVAQNMVKNLYRDILNDPNLKYVN